MADGPIRLFGFLLEASSGGGAAYSYLLKEYKAANDLLTEDIYVRTTKEQNSIDVGYQMWIWLTFHRPFRPRLPASATTSRFE